MNDPVSKSSLQPFERYRGIKMLIRFKAIFLLVLGIAFLSACATQSGGGKGGSCNANGGSAWDCVTPLTNEGSCSTGGFESVVSNFHNSKSVIVKIETSQRPVAVGSIYPKRDTYNLKPGESKTVGCSRGQLGQRWLYYHEVVEARFGQ